MIDNRNMILAIVLSIAILMGFQMYFDATRPPPPVQDTTEQQAAPGAVPQPVQSADGTPSLPTTMEEGVPVPPGSATPTVGMTPVSYTHLTLPTNREV